MTNTQLEGFRKIAALMLDGVEAAEAEDALDAGELCVFVDYAGRTIGGRVQRINEGWVWVRVIGDQGPYQNGMTICRELKNVTRAI